MFWACCQHGWVAEDAQFFDLAADDDVDPQDVRVPGMDFALVCISIFDIYIYIQVRYHAMEFAANITSFPWTADFTNLVVLWHSTLPVQGAARSKFVSSWNPWNLDQDHFLELRHGVNRDAFPLLSRQRGCCHFQNPNLWDNTNAFGEEHIRNILRQWICMTPKREARTLETLMKNMSLLQWRKK